MFKTHLQLILTLGLLIAVAAKAPAQGNLIQISNTSAAAVATNRFRVLIDCWPTTAGRKLDLDNDGIVDRCEQTLAEKFAPIVFHDAGEEKLPTNVDWFLQRTSLRYYDDGCEPDLDIPVLSHPSQADLLRWSYQGGCDDVTDTVFSNDTRSERKQRTFYLADVADGDKPGSSNTADWTTYFHAYRNDRRGVTIQYWRFYAADGGKDPVIGVFGGHGGDWEGIHVVLDDCLRPVQVNLMGHTGIERVPWDQMSKDGNHPKIFSEAGGHASHNLPSFLPSIFRFTQQQTWTGGTVHWDDGRVTPGGALLNIGEKMAPLNGQFFIRYSGIWGSPGLLYATSGYWDPAYNETMKGADNFIEAWCTGRAADIPREECYPRFTSR
jgi:hypothetical protein